MKNQLFKRNIIPSICFLVMFVPFVSAQTEFCGLPYVDIWDSTDLDTFLKVATVKAIETAQTGQQHYDYYGSSGHPVCVNLQSYAANTWIQKDTDTEDLTFGFIFGKQYDGVNNNAQLNFRIVDSSTVPYISQSDDPGEAMKHLPVPMLSLEITPI